MRKIGKILQSVLLIALSMILIGNVTMIIAGQSGNRNVTVIGYSWAVVLTGSMEPTISVDDMVVSHAQSDYEVGDIVTYARNTSLVTHRIVEKTGDEFVTQGDANNAPDINRVEKDEVVGKVVLILPGVGRMVRYLRSSTGLMCVLVVGAAMLLIPRLFDKDTDSEDSRRRNA